MTLVFDYGDFKRMYYELLLNPPEDPFSRYYKIMCMTQNLYYYVADKNTPIKEKYKCDYYAAVYELRSLGYKVEGKLHKTRPKHVPGIRPELLESCEKPSCEQKDMNGIINDGERIEFEYDIGDDHFIVDDELDPVFCYSDIDDIDGVIDGLDDDIRILEQSEDDGKDEEDIPDFRYDDFIWME